MSYKEFRDDNGYFHKEGAPAKINYYSNGSVEWEVFFFNGRRHREDGPAYIRYNPNGLIICELFYVSGEYLGLDKKGFWALWDRLTEEGRQAPSLLKYLARYL